MCMSQSDSHKYHLSHLKSEMKNNMFLMIAWIASSVSDKMNKIIGSCINKNRAHFHKVSVIILGSMVA